MPISTCPGCGSHAEFPADQVGQGIQCPDCGASFVARAELSADPKAVGIATVIAVVTVVAGVWLSSQRVAPVPANTGAVGAEDPARFGGAPPPPVIQPGPVTNSTNPANLSQVGSQKEPLPDGGPKTEQQATTILNNTGMSTANVAAEPAEVELTPQQQLIRLERSVVRVRAKTDTSEEIACGFIASQDLVVTVRSHLRGARRVTIQFRDETFQEASGVVADDEQRGLVAVRVATERRPALRLVSSLPDAEIAVSAIAFAGNRTVPLMGRIVTPAPIPKIERESTSWLNANFSNGVPILGSPFLNSRGDVVAIATGTRMRDSEVIPSASGLDIQEVIARPARQPAPFPGQNASGSSLSDKPRQIVDLSGSNAGREMLAKIREVFVETEPTRDDVTGRLNSIALLHYEQSFRNTMAVAIKKQPSQPVFRLVIRTQRIEGEAEHLVQLVASIVVPAVNETNELVDTMVYQNSATVGQISTYELSKGNIPQSVSDSIQGQAEQLENLIRRLRRTSKSR